MKSFSPPDVKDVHFIFLGHIQGRSRPMIAEVITVTTTPTSIAALIATARSLAAIAVTKCSQVKLKCAVDAAITVSIKEAGSVAGVVILDAPNGQFSTEIAMFDFSQALLSSASGTVAVQVLVEQPRM